jgi:hypothetical protein
MTTEPTRATAKTVRNILANELGLSREAVQEMIQEAINERLRRTDFETLLKDQVALVLNEMAKDSKFNRSYIQGIIQREVLERVKNKLDITIDVKGKA